MHASYLLQCCKTSPDGCSDVRTHGDVSVNIDMNDMNNIVVLVMHRCDRNSSSVNQLMYTLPALVDNRTLIMFLNSLHTCLLLLDNFYNHHLCQNIGHGTSAIVVDGFAADCGTSASKACTLTWQQDV